MTGPRVAAFAAPPCGVVARWGRRRGEERTCHERDGDCSLPVGRVPPRAARAAGGRALRAVLLRVLRRPAAVLRAGAGGGRGLRPAVRRPLAREPVRLPP